MSRAKGDIAEQQAITYLKVNGYEIIDQNFYSRFGEIDIIAKKEDILHIIEVKSALDYEVAIANITPKKLQRIIKTAEIYMKKNGFNGNYTYDAVIVTPEEIELLEDITI
ncbi:MAG: YraN family protein [Epsilonproteobacteria bacterium]|nr:YraN family protein [Campylobacterota bacterium]